MMHDMHQLLQLLMLYLTELYQQPTVQYRWLGSFVEMFKIIEEIMYTIVGLLN